MTIQRFANVAAAITCWWVVQGFSADNATSESQRCIAVLQSNATTYEKARACQQLAGIGGPETVPALAGLLADEKLNGYARGVLETINDPSATATLREALNQLQGNCLIGVINSLGVRRDTQAVNKLRQFAGGNNSEVTAAALAALGRIATPEAIETLQQSLTSGTEGLRAVAAKASLVAADQQLAQGHRDAASALYGTVSRTEVPKHLQLAAMRRFILTADTSQSVPLLMEQLRADDPANVEMALRTARQLQGTGVAQALIAELAAARPAVQVGLLQTLADRHDPGAIAAVERLVTSERPEVRKTALTVLGKIGGDSSITMLLKLLAGAPSEDDTIAALASLSELTSGKTASMIVAALPSLAPAVRAQVINMLGNRNVPEALEAILKHAGDSNEEVSKAAFGALSIMARPANLPVLIQLATACRNDSVRPTAERAVVETSQRLGDVSSRGGAIAAALRESSDVNVKCSLIRMLGMLGNLPAYRTLAVTLQDPDNQVRNATLRILADWPDATPAALLLETVRTASDPMTRRLAWRGAVRMAGQAAAECAYPSRQAVAWLKQASQTVLNEVEEKRLLLSGLANSKCVEGLLLVQPYWEDSAVRGEAERALVLIAQQMPTERSMAKRALEKLVTSTQNETVRDQARELIKQIPGQSVEPRLLATKELDVEALTFHPLFDGQTFNGWEGDIYRTFRIENGAIVGGNLAKGIPQNEFLCTTRSYANFILRLECKLIKSNAGIQLRSQRVPSSSEVCGYQADMDDSGYYWGCLYDESRRGMLVKGDQNEIMKHVKSGDWNLYEIRCEGPRIQLFVNGTQTADYTEKDEAILQSGIIGLQIHGGGPSEAWYRNIKVAELP